MTYQNIIVVYQNIIVSICIVYTQHIHDISPHQIAQMQIFPVHHSQHRTSRHIEHESLQHCLRIWDITISIIMCFLRVVLSGYAMRWRRGWAMSAMKP
jgi:hypothetical protein